MRLNETDVPLVHLRDYATLERVYALDVLTGRHELTRDVEPPNTSGYGMELKARHSARHLFLAAYAVSDKMWLQCNESRYELSDPSIRIRLTRPIPFLRRFVVQRDGQPLLQFTAWARVKELREWPLPGDYLAFLVDVTTNPDEILLNTLRWQAAAAGLSLLNESVQEQLQKRFLALRRGTE